MRRIKTLTGAASFYIVAFSTLILVIIATSFATVILSEVTRSMNDDLSQSAYDSALAGVEDAKLAYANYQRCVEAGYSAKGVNGDGQVSCEEIIYWMENPDCDMVGHILGRLPDNQEGGEVLVSDTITTNKGDVVNNLNQAYTCVVINTKLNDYKANLSSSNQVRVMKAEFDGTAAKDIKSVKIGWYSQRDGETFAYNNFLDDKSAVVFQPLTSMAVSRPPVVELALVQTAENFTFEHVVAKSSGGKTNRATMYLVPINDCTKAKKENDEGDAYSYWGTNEAECSNNTPKNVIESTQVVKTNDQNIRNLPFGVWCPSNSSEEFLCSVEIKLPEPLNGERNNDTFMFVVTLPYAQPDTDFSLQFVKDGGEIAYLKGTQVLIDSTGRANDLYRRVEVRMESADVSFPYTYYALELLGSGSVMNKDMTVTCERNAYDGIEGNGNPNC